MSTHEERSWGGAPVLDEDSMRELLVEADFRQRCFSRQPMRSKGEILTYRGKPVHELRGQELITAVEMMMKAL